MIAYPVNGISDTPENPGVSFAVIPHTLEEVS